MSYEPKIIGFLCNWCSYTGADLAGTARLKYPANLVAIRVMCSGRVDPGFIFDAFRKGADGVLVCGCHPGDCHYAEGNTKCMRRMAVTRLLLEQMGVPRGRLRLEWISASEGGRFQEVVTEFTQQIRALGPFHAGGNGAGAAGGNGNRDAGGSEARQAAVAAEGEASHAQA